jgi:hypothetical protein
LCEPDSSASGLGPVTNSCEEGNETFGKHKNAEFLGHPSEHYLLKKDSASWKVNEAFHRS